MARRTGPQASGISRNAPGPPPSPPTLSFFGKLSNRSAPRPYCTVVLQDLRLSFREMRKRPGLAITAIVSLMLGIGATTAVFSVIYGLLSNPYPDPSRREK
jgi:hypothetical protein